LGKTGDRTNSTELINALEHPNGNVRRLAASALGKLRDKRAVPALLALLTKENKPQVRQYAVKALGRIRDGRAYAALQQIAQDDTERYSTRRTAIAALRRLRK
jgi:HEAT repeat protein